jgi:hypothetical protein
MATGTIILTPGSVVIPDDTTFNKVPALQRVKSAGSGNFVDYFLQLAFDAAQEEIVTWQFRMPDDYASAPVVKIQYKMLAATTGAVVWVGRISATTPGDAKDVDTAVFDSANSATSTVPATPGYMAEATVTLTSVDSLAAGDFVVFRLSRDGASGSDTAAGDAEFLVAAFTYTTT